MTFAGPSFRLQPPYTAQSVTDAPRDSGAAAQEALFTVTRPTPEPTHHVPVSDGVSWKAAQRAAHLAVEAAEEALLAEQGRPASRERWQRLATAFEDRAFAWRQLAATTERDTFGHNARAMCLAANADEERAKAIRVRLGVRR
jgi:hypothetical protein